MNTTQVILIITSFALVLIACFSGDKPTQKTTKTPVNDVAITFWNAENKIIGQYKMELRSDQIYYDKKVEEKKD